MDDWTQWYYEVNHEVEIQTGFSIEEMGEEVYVHYNNGLTPKEALLALGYSSQKLRV